MDGAPVRRKPSIVQHTPPRDRPERPKAATLASRLANRPRLRGEAPVTAGASGKKPATPLPPRPALDRPGGAVD
jgi:hypothetical protein